MEKDVCHYVDSIFYAMEQTVTYLGVKGAQFFNQINIGVTVDQFAVLDAIYTNNDICQRDLSKLILKDRSNTGRILNILEKNGFITREIETRGKRLVKKVYITAKGKSIIDDNHEKLKNAFENIFEDISEEEFSNLRLTLSKIRNGLSKNTNMQI